MTPRFSLYLDFLRFMAAMVVFISHFAYPRFTDGAYIWVRELNLGSDAVVFFFVLSGLVIAYTTEVKDKSLKDYSFNRFTRLYSVIVPALLLTVVLDMAGQALAPENYDGWWYEAAPIWEQLVRGLSLTNQWSGQDFRIGSNGPYWSLSYEAAYYILFGVGFYLSGMKRVLLLIFLVPIFGVSVLFLLPIWFLGVWTYKQIKAQSLPPAYMWPCILLPPIIYGALLFMHTPETLLNITRLVLGEDFVNIKLHFSDEFIWNLIIAQLVAFHLIGVAALFQCKGAACLPDKVFGFVRWCAGATFTLYIVHYPALQFIDAALPADLNGYLRHILLFLLVFFLCLVFAELSERRLKWFRRKINV